MNREQAERIARGRELVSSGKINPEKEMLRFERTGYISANSWLAFLYWGYLLQDWADSAAESLASTHLNTSMPRPSGRDGSGALRIPASTCSPSVRFWPGR